MSIQLWRKIEGQNREYYFTRSMGRWGGTKKVWGVAAGVRCEAAIGRENTGEHEVIRLTYAHAWGPEDPDIYEYLWRNYDRIEVAEAPELLKIEKNSGLSVSREKREVGNTIIQQIIQRLEDK